MESRRLALRNTGPKLSRHIHVPNVIRQCYALSLGIRSNEYRLLRAPQVATTYQYLGRIATCHANETRNFIGRAAITSPCFPCLPQIDNGRPISIQGNTQLGDLETLDVIADHSQETMKKSGVVWLQHATGSRCAKC
jgi:hypothetical protein